MPSLTSKIVVGQRVHCRLMGLGDGIVFALTDTPSMRLCVDVVFNNGQISRAVPDTIVRGPQWDLLPVIEPPARVAEALADAAIMKAQRSVAASRAEDELAILQERLRRDPRFIHLQQGDDRASGKLAAGNVRRVLAASFKGIRFSVRREGYGPSRFPVSHQGIVSTRSATRPSPGTSRRGVQRTGFVPVRSPLPRSSPLPRGATLRRRCHPTARRGAPRSSRQA